MAYRQTCLVSSDEEDEDGNLGESAPVSESVPVGEVIYLPEDTSNFQPEEEQATVQPQKVTRQSIKVKSLDALTKTTAGQEKSVETTKNKSNSPVKANNNNNSENVIKKSGTVKAADLMPPPIKRENSNTADMNNYKKSKYSRQATPICDAIMKEYSKRSKGPSHNTSEGSDAPLKELLNKAKSKEEEEQNVKKDKPSTNKSDTPIQESNEEKSGDPLTFVKQEIIDIKPETIYVPVTSVDIKQEKNNSLCLSPQSDKSNFSSSKYNQTSRGRGRGRGRGRTQRGNQRKRKYQFSDDEDDTDEDPDFNPSAEAMKTRRVTRSGRRTTSFYSSKTQEDEVSLSDTVHSEVSDTVQSDESQESVSIPKDKALDVAGRLKNLAERISDVLRKEPSPNINIEAEKLLHTTQELIDMQKKTLQNSEKGTFSSVSTVKIKQEITDTPENGKEISTQSETGRTVTNTSVAPPSSAQHSLHIFNQLQGHKAALQKKLSESSSKNVTNVAKSVVPHNLPNSGDEISEPVSVQEKCTFIMDFFTSYKEVFDEHTVSNLIPILSDNIMLCVHELTECMKRTKRAEMFESNDLKQQEINLAKQSYLKIIMSSGESFFPCFNIVIDKIIQSKTSKALVNTLILYIAGSLTMKDPKLKNNVHRLRRVLLFICKAHKYHHILVTQVLQADNSVFDDEIKLIRQMLKYFQSRRFLQIPSEILCSYPDNSVEEEQQFQSELSVMDTAFMRRNDPYVRDIDSPVEGTLNQNAQLGVPSSSAGSAENQARLSSITLEFVEALRSERDGNTKRIEKKLDYILNVLSGKVEHLGSKKNISQNNLTRPQMNHEKGISDSQNFKVWVNLGKRVPNVPTVKLSSVHTLNDQHASLPDDKGVLLAQLLENDNVGLDSLFSSYLKSSNERTVRVKSEPVDNTDSFDQTTDISTQQVFVKQEPNDVFLSENRKGQPNVNEQALLEDTIFGDPFTEEYNFTKSEQDFVDADPFS